MRWIFSLNIPCIVYFSENKEMLQQINVALDTDYFRVFSAEKTARTVRDRKRMYQMLLASRWRLRGHEHEIPCRGVKFQMTYDRSAN